MNFFKIKVAFLILLMMSVPIITVLVCPVKERVLPDNPVVNVYDVKTQCNVVMKTEEYITGVVAAEMPAEFHTEALKAQAVAARTYLRKKGECANHPESDICTDSSHCQAYKSVYELKEQWGNDFKKYYNKIGVAVNSTRGEIIVYNGEPISAVFHSTGSGRTENASDIWGNSRPYLISVESLGDEKSPKFASTKVFSMDEFKRIIKEKNNDASFDETLISDITLTEGGSVDRIRIGGVFFKGTEIREMFSLNSAHFAIDITGDDVIFDVRGYGHGVGMSQYGAQYMAESGSTYRDILKKYYYGTDIIVHG